MFKGFRPFRLALLSLGLVSLASCCICGAQNPARAQSTPQDATFRMAGTIVNALDGSPLGRALVSIADMSILPNLVSMTTLLNGNSEFLPPKAGNVSLQRAMLGATLPS